MTIAFENDGEGLHLHKGKTTRQEIMDIMILKVSGCKYLRTKLKSEIIRSHYNKYEF